MTSGTLNIFLTSSLRIVEVDFDHSEKLRDCLLASSYFDAKYQADLVAFKPNDEIEYENDSKVAQKVIDLGDLSKANVTSARVNKTLANLFPGPLDENKIHLIVKGNPIRLNIYLLNSHCVRTVHVPEGTLLEQLSDYLDGMKVTAVYKPNKPIPFRSPDDTEQVMNDLIATGHLSDVGTSQILDDTIGSVLRETLARSSIHLLVRCGTFPLNAYLLNSHTVRVVDIPESTRLKDLSDYLDGMKVTAVYKPNKQITFRSLDDTEQVTNDILAMGRLSEAGTPETLFATIGSVLREALPRSSIHLLVQGDILHLCIYLLNSHTVCVVDIPESTRLKDLSEYLDGMKVAAVYKPNKQIPFRSLDDTEQLTNDILAMGRLSEAGTPETLFDTIGSVLREALPRSSIHLLVQGDIFPLCIYLLKSHSVCDVNIPGGTNLKDLSDYLNGMKVAAVYKPQKVVPFHSLADLPRVAKDVAEMGDLLVSCKRGAKISDLFKEILSNNVIHLIVDGMDRTVTPNEDLDTLSSLPVYDTNREHFYSMKPTGAPSSQGISRNFSKAQRDPRVTSYCGRPAEATRVIPPILFNPALAQFSHDLYHCTPSNEDISCYDELSLTQSSIFKKETDRMVNFRDILRSHGFPPFRDDQIAHKYPTDGHLTHFLDGVPTPFVSHLVEGKPEISCGGAEPFFQAINYFIEANREHILSLDKRLRNRTNFPGIILLHFGAYLAAAAYIYTNSPVVQILTPIIPLFSHPTDIQARAAGERFIGALRISLKGLENHYLKEISARTPAPNPFFPYKDSFTKDHNEVGFVYENAIDDTKRIFRVHYKDKPRERACVKFVLRYGTEAHRCASTHHFGPKLLAVEPLYDWKMVVMEEISSDYITIYDLDPLPAEDRQKVITALLKCLEILHSFEYVHSDMRGINAFVHKLDLTKIIIVDWDWAGPVGQTFYPHNMNPDVWRPVGAKPGALVIPEHDIEMAKRIFG